MAIVVNHDGSFHAVTQAAIQDAFTAAVAPQASGLTGQPARFDAYRAALAAYQPPDQANAARLISNDLSDLFPEYSFAEPGDGPSVLQYFDGLGTLIYMITQDPA